MNQCIEICLAVAACCSLVSVSAHPTTYNTLDQADECLEEQSPMQLGYAGGSQIYDGAQTWAAKSIAEPIYSAGAAPMFSSGAAQAFSSGAAPAFSSGAAPILKYAAAAEPIINSAAAAPILKYAAAEPIINSAAAAPILKYAAAEPIIYSAAAAPILKYAAAEPIINSAAAAAPILKYGQIYDGRDTAAVVVSGGGESTLRTYDHRPSAEASNSVLKISNADANFAIGARASLRPAHASGSYAAGNTYAVPSAAAYQTLNRKWTDSKHAAEAQYNAAATSRGHSLYGSIAAAQSAQPQQYYSSLHGYAGAAQPQYQSLGHNARGPIAYAAAEDELCEE